jgi:hypothetical protein
MESGVFGTRYQDLTRDLIKIGVGADEGVLILVIENDVDIVWLSQGKGLQRSGSSP